MSTAQWLILDSTMALLLSGVAAVAYIIGRRSRLPTRDLPAEIGEQPSGLLTRELGDISQGVRRRLATHQASILRFRERISQLSSGHDGPVWQLLVQEAERVLKPTEELSAEIAQAYNEIREQTNSSPEAANDRLDSLTGLHSRASIEGTILFLLALKARYDNIFSLVLVEVDNLGDFNRKQGRVAGDRVLRELTAVINESMRDTDAAGRFDGEEFVIVLPETGLPGAGVFGERLRQKVEQRLPISISCGLASVADGDTPATILSRADSALYSAKAAGHNCVFEHTGRNINQLTKHLPAQVVARAEPADTAASPLATVGTTNP